MDALRALDNRREWERRLGRIRKNAKPLEKTRKSEKPWEEQGKLIINVTSGIGLVT